jgi:hypothetical protein
MFASYCILPPHAPKDSASTLLSKLRPKESQTATNKKATMIIQWVGGGPHTRPER